MRMSRRRSQSTFHRIYKFIDNGGICVYCGVRASTIDHFVPLSVVATLYSCLDVIQGRVLVPACSDCNSIAGNNMFRTIAAKRRFIQSRLIEKNKRLLNSPRWEDEDVAELG